MGIGAGYGGSLKGSDGANTNALFNAQVGGVLGQNAVENNALDRLDGFTPGERSLRDRADKIYQNNQKDKDLYIRAYEAYELKASYLAAKEIVVGTWEGIRHPWDNTIVPLVEAVSSPVQTTNKIVMSYENWKAVRDEAYISDPQLAGRMDAMFDARVGANAAFMVVSGGTASAIVRSPAAAKVVKSAGNLSKIVRKAEAPPGKAVPVGEARIPQSPQAVKGTTVTLAQEQRLANGELIPKGSVVTWSDNAVKVVRPDGKKRRFNSRDWEQKALPAPTAMLFEPIIQTRISQQVMLTTKQKLPPAIVDTFKNGMYQTVTTKEPITVYRKFGGTDKQAKLLGGYATTISNAGRSETAVYPRWSSMQFEAVIEIPKNQSINIGKVAPQPLNKKIPKYRGGEDQILLPVNYPISWVKFVRDGKTGKVYTPSEFIKQFPEQINRK